VYRLNDWNALGCTRLITTRTDQGKCIVEMCDIGPGPPNEITQVFEGPIGALHSPNDPESIGTAGLVHFIIASRVADNLVTGASKQFPLLVKYDILSARRTRTIEIVNEKDFH
jgi:hypothetical protein